MPLIKIKVKYGTANKIFNVERTLPNIHEVFVAELKKKYPNDTFEVVYRLKDVEIKVVDTPSLLAAIDDCIKNKQAFLQLEGVMEAAPEPPKEEPKAEPKKEEPPKVEPKKEEPKPAAAPAPAAAPKAEPKKEEPPKAEPKKEEPKPAAAPAPAAAPKPKFCSNCGASLSGGKFCAECGAPTSGEAKPAAPAPAAEPETKPQRPSTPPKNVLDEDETKCGKCGKIVEGGIKALGKYWHTECFVCSVCGEQFGGPRKLMEHDGKPICNGCYEETCVPRCFKCGKPLNGKYLVVDGHEYHPDCFVCTRCGKPFSGSYMLVAGKPVCKKCV